MVELPSPLCAAAERLDGPLDTVVFLDLDLTHPVRSVELQANRLKERTNPRDGTLKGARRGGSLPRQDPSVKRQNPSDGPPSPSGDPCGGHATVTDAKT